MGWIYQLFRGNSNRLEALKTENARFQKEIKDLKPALVKALQELDEANRDIKQLQEKAKEKTVAVNSSDELEALKGRGTAVFRSAKLDLAPQDWVGKYGVGISKSQAVIRFSNMKQHMIADTNSMLPTLDKDSVILVLPREHWGEKLPIVGDIVVWQKKGNINSVCHRVVKVKGTGKDFQVITQGDNCRNADTWIKLEEIKSVVVGIVY